jgi:sugar phosphate isomerase/epimerase
MRAFSAAAAAAVLFGLASASRAAEPASKRDDSASEKLGLKLSLQCWTFNRLSFFETVDKAVELGVKYLEMYPGQRLKPGSEEKVGRTMSEQAIAEVKKKLYDAGVKLVAYGVDGIPTDEAGARKTFDWAKKMGIEVLVTETTPNDIIDKLSQETGIRVALHNHPTTWPPDKVLDATKGKNKLVGACCDTGHWMRAGFVPVDTLKKVEGRVEHLHFKDLNDFGKGHDVRWGTGRGDVKGMLTELKRQGYKGYLSIEYEYGDLPHLAENLPRCVAYFDEVTAELAK